jgi:acetyltransferase-like isoleucine patch superfamily enzyme
MRRTPKGLIKHFGFTFLVRIGSLLDRARTAALRESLGYCGCNVAIRPPTVIEVPNNVFIEDGVSIASFVHIWGNGGVRIGRRTMIASHVAIASVTHDPNAACMSATLVAQPVVIEHDVWIGAHAIILPGVRIGENSVVAAGSLVRNDVSANTIVAGTPAVPMRTKVRSPEPRASVAG